MLSFALEYRWFGLNLFLFNLTNLLLYLFVSLFVFKVASFLLKNRILGFLMALLFVAHSINAEFAFHVAGCSILLCAFLGWSSLILYFSQRKEKDFVLYFIFDLFFLCSLK